MTYTRNKNIIKNKSTIKVSQIGGAVASPNINNKTVDFDKDVKPLLKQYINSLRVNSSDEYNAKSEIINITSDEFTFIVEIMKKFNKINKINFNIVNYNELDNETLKQIFENIIQIIFDNSLTETQIKINIKKEQKNPHDNFETLKKLYLKHLPPPPLQSTTTPSSNTPTPTPTPTPPTPPLQSTTTPPPLQSTNTSQSQKPLFETIMTLPDNAKIITFSDIHADIDALIINLRDCAGVIKKSDKWDELTANIGGINLNEYYIKKENTQDNNDILVNKRVANNDILLEYLLRLDLNNKEEKKIFDDNVLLGYEWCGDGDIPIYVVIIGDILDGKRYMLPPEEHTKPQYDRFNKTEVNVTYKLNGTETFEIAKQYIHQYNQVEIKILKFLNEIDIQASKNQSRIIKLVGNHEMMNFTIPTSEYIFGNNILLLDNYMDKISRSDYFNFENEGFKLYKERGTGIMLILKLKGHNHVFVHGGLKLEFIKYIKDHEDLKKQNYDFISIITKYNELLIKDFVYDEIKKMFARDIKIKDEEQRLFHNLTNLLMSDTNGNPLWTRVQGDKEATIKNNLCVNLEFVFNNLGKDFTNDFTNDNTSLFIGHCPNYIYVSEDRTTFANLGTSEPSDKNIKFICNTTNCNHNNYSASSLRNFSTLEDYDKIVGYGITFDCPSIKKNINKLYRVDVGVSRAFDKTNDKLNTSDKDINVFVKYLLGRLPQILEIQQDTKFQEYNPIITIKRAKLLQTLRSQTRLNYEEHIKTNNFELLKTALNPLPQITGGYHKKNIKIRNTKWKIKSKKMLNQKNSNLKHSTKKTS